MLTIIGAGLSSIDDMTLRGVKALKDSDYIYLDMYTSIMGNCLESIEKLTGKSVIMADRDLLEQGDEIIDRAAVSEVAIVVIGDPLSATTHTGCCGLQLYNFGATVSIPFWDENSKPESFFDKIIWNMSQGLHTLCLLDIRVKERTVENILRDREIYEPPRFMTCSNAADQIVDIIRNRTLPPEHNYLNVNDLIAVGLARVGSEKQTIAFSALASFTTYQNCAVSILGGPLHTLVIPGKLHPLEGDFLLASSRSKENSVSLPEFFSTSNRDNLLTEAQALVNRHNKLIDSCIYDICKIQYKAKL